MNIFDVIVIGATLVAVVMGYRSGLLRSLATIFGYLLAAPVAIVATPKLAPLFSVQTATPGATNVLLFAGVFLGTGFLMGAMLSSAVSFATGENVSLPDLSLIHI